MGSDPTSSLRREVKRDLKMKGVQNFVGAGFGCALITKEALATQHVVGGSQGWDESTDFSSWASGQTFKVGDQLVFKYSPGLHSIVELASESAYKNSDIGSAVDSMNGGNDVVKLNKAGTRYFACGTLGHCDQGMKVKITTVSADSPSTPGSSSSSPPPSSSTPTSTSAAFAFNPVASTVPMFAILVFCLIFMLKLCESLLKC